MMQGFAARLTIKLPSGRKQSYGTLPGDSSTNGARAIQPRVYHSTKVAKESVASLAIESGVLEWIRSEESPTVPSPRKTITTLEPARRERGHIPLDIVSLFLLATSGSNKLHLANPLCYRTRLGQANKRRP